MPEKTIAERIPSKLLRRPLLEIVFFFVAGIMAGIWLPPADIPLITALVLALAVIFFVLQPGPPWLKNAAGVFFFIAVFSAGFLAASVRMNNPSPDYLAALMTQPREGVEIIGKISDDPALRKNWSEDYQYWSFTMQGEAVNRTGAFQKARGEIKASMPVNTMPAIPHYGQRWKFNGVLIDKTRLSGFSGMDAVSSQLPCRFAFRISGIPAPLLISQPSAWDIIHWCVVLREKCSDILKRGVENRPDAAAILQALVLGRQYELSTRLHEVFVATGTYHIFAISGQHIAIIALFIIAVLQVYGVCRLQWFYFLAPLLIVFTIMTGLSASAVRGCIMGLVCFLGPLFKRKTDISSAMALAALLILAFDPLQLFQAGFLLSFGIVAGLIGLCPPLIDIAKRKIDPDPWQLQPENIVRRKTRRLIGWFIFMVLASFVAWLVSTPLMARWFNLVSFSALFANLAVIPLATVVLLLGCLSIIFGFLPVVPEILNNINAFCVSLMLGVTKFLADVPGGHIFVKSPPLWLVCLWFVFLVVWRVWYKRKIVWLSALLVFALAAAGTWWFQKKDWQIHVVNVADCAVGIVDCAAGKILINTGPEYQAGNILNYLHRQGFNRLAALVLPGPDSEHAGAAGVFFNSFPVKEVIIQETKSKSARELLHLLKENKINVLQTNIADNKILLSQPEGLNVHADAVHLPGCLTLEMNYPKIEIIIEEFSSTSDNQPSGSNQHAYHIVCCPAAEDMEWLSHGWRKDLSLEKEIILGPGQGVCFTPDKEHVNIRAVLLR
jgi:ComEC/Rec2-related protein